MPLPNPAVRTIYFINLWINSGMIIGKAANWMERGRPTLSIARHWKMRFVLGDSRYPKLPHSQRKPLLSGRPTGWTRRHLCGAFPVELGDELESMRCTGTHSRF